MELALPIEASDDETGMLSMKVQLMLSTKQLFVFGKSYNQI
jgi:hypothetical protein